MFLEISIIFEKWAKLLFSSKKKGASDIKIVFIASWMSKNPFLKF